MKVFHSLIVVALMFFAISAHSCAEDSPQQLVERILLDWKARQSQIRSIHVELSGTMFHPKGCYDKNLEPVNRHWLTKLGHVPAEDTRNRYNKKLLIQFENNWVRKETDRFVMHENIARFVPHRETKLFDGKQIRVYEPREENTSSEYTPAGTQPDLWLQATDFSDAVFDNEDHPIFWACGLVNISAIKLQRMKAEPMPRDYLFVGHGEIDGRQCVILRSPNLRRDIESRYQFWVDVEAGSSVLRSQYHEGGQLEFQLDVKWQTIEGKPFPRTWQYAYYLPEGIGSRLYNSVEHRVERVVFNPSVDAADFDVKLRPGLVVRDVGLDIDGVVGPDGKTLLPLSQIESISRRTFIRTLLLWIGGVIVVLLAGWFLVRRWVLRAAQ